MTADIPQQTIPELLAKYGINEMEARSIWAVLYTTTFPKLSDNPVSPMPFTCMCGVYRWLVNCLGTNVGSTLESCVNPVVASCQPDAEDPQLLVIQDGAYLVFGAEAVGIWTGIPCDPATLPQFTCLSVLNLKSLPV
jgi:hypothetical protein